jgi:hypothetical protein
MNDDFKIAAKLTVYDAACLPGLIQKEIEAVVRRKRGADQPLSAEDEEHLNQYIGQLRNCLTAIELARAEALGRPQKPKR